MQSSDRRIRIALVNPPFGPANLPNLGISLLAAGVRQHGFDCEVLYWNLKSISGLPAETAKARLELYTALSGRSWFPYNEWLYTHGLHGGAMCEQDRITAANLSRRLDWNGVGGGIGIDELIDFREVGAPRGVDALARSLQGHDLVGISTTFFQNAAALSLAKRVKALSPSTCVVLGGANCDGEMGKALIRLYPFIDRVAQGEADRSFLVLAQALQAGAGDIAIDGMLHRALIPRHRPEFASAESATEVALGDLPPPCFDDYRNACDDPGLARFETAYPLESSRGCWWGERSHCTFCGLNGDAMRYRTKPLQRTIAEMRSLIEREGARRIFMTDNICPVPYIDALESETAALPYRPSLFYEVKANMRRAQVASLARAGVRTMQPGIESFSTPLLALMKKGITGIQNVAFLKYAVESGVSVVYNLLYGFPGEDADWYRAMINSLSLLRHFPPPSSAVPVEFHRFSPFHERAAAHGLTLRCDPRYHALYPFDLDTVSQLAYFFIRADPEPLLDYEQALVEAVSTWHASWSGGRYRLEWWLESDSIVVFCRRDGTESRTVLEGFDAELFSWLAEAPRTHTSLLQRLSTRPGRPMPAARSGQQAPANSQPAEPISDWLERGWLYAEARSDNSVAQWLALPLQADRPPADMSFLGII